MFRFYLALKTAFHARDSPDGLKLMRNSLPFCTTVPPSADPSLQVCACQAELIRELAERGPCVIVGRGADYILQERSDCLNVFFHAAMDHRIRFIAGELGIGKMGFENFVKIILDGKLWN